MDNVSHSIPNSTCPGGRSDQGGCPAPLLTPVSEEDSSGQTWWWWWWWSPVLRRDRIDSASGASVPESVPSTARLLRVESLTVSLTLNPLMLLQEVGGVAGGQCGQCGGQLQ